MKKILALTSIFLSLTLILVSFTPVYAESENKSVEDNEVLESENASDFYKINRIPWIKIVQILNILFHINII
mgnify:CR=1 FL=1